MVDLKWLTMCATAGEFLYGDFTTSVLKQMYEKKKGYTVSLDELVASMKELEKAGEVLLTYSPGQLDDTDPAGRGFFTPKDCRGTELEAVLRKADAEGNPYASIHFDPDEELDFHCRRPGNPKTFLEHQGNDNFTGRFRVLYLDREGNRRACRRKLHTHGCHDKAGRSGQEQGRKPGLLESFVGQDFHEQAGADGGNQRGNEWGVPRSSWLV